MNRLSTVLVVLVALMMGCESQPVDALRKGERCDQLTLRLQKQMARGCVYRYYKDVTVVEPIEALRARCEEGAPSGYVVEDCPTTRASW